MNYKSKNYTVDAIQFKNGSIDALMEFTEGSITRVERSQANTLVCTIDTIEGTVTVKEGQYAPTYGSSSRTVSNDVVIPLRIYGVTIR